MPGTWALRYTGVDVDFTEESGVTLRDFPSESSPTITDEDGLNVRGDGSYMGVDTIGGRTIPLTFAIDGDSEADVRSKWAKLRGWWRADSIRAIPGALAELVSDQGRSAFGRPRRIEPSLAWFHDPVMTIEADFASVDDLWYGAEDSLTVPFALTQAGGFVFPLVFPMVSRGYTSAANTFTVAGEEPTWPVVTIRGPVLNPTVSVAGRFSFTAQTSLAYDETLTIDTRPGRQTVLRNGSRIAALSRTSTLLPDASLPPGQYTFTLSGSSSSGVPSAQIVWRAAYSTP